MFGWVESASTSLSANVGSLARISCTSCCPDADASMLFRVAESALALSGSAINNALKALRFFVSCLPLLVLRVVWTMRASPELSFCAPLSTMVALCRSA